MAAQKKNSRKAQYYVMYLGWKECRGVAGREFTEPIVKDLFRKRSTDYLPKLTLEVSKKEIKINQIVEKDQKGKPKIDKRKYPPIPTKDVTYAVQALSPDEDTVACIYLGFNPRTQCAVHVHVYKCDSVQTAESLVEHINQVISNPEHEKRVGKIEAELVKKGQIVGRSANEDRSESGSESNSTEKLDRRDMRLPRIPSVEKQSPPPVRSQQNNSYGYPQDYQQYPQDYPPNHYSPLDEEALKEERDREMSQSLADEFKQRLQGGIQSPMLVPPKDYDTVRVTKDYENRRWRTLDPEKPEQSRSPQHSRGNSYDDSARGESEGSQRSSGISQSDYNQAVDNQVFSQFELRSGDGYKPRENIRNLEDPRVADKTDRQVQRSSIEEDSSSKPAWAKDLFDNPKPETNGYSKDPYRQQFDNNPGAEKDLQAKVPHWKRSENYYHQQHAPSSRPVIGDGPPGRALVQEAPQGRAMVQEPPPGRPMSPMPMVPYDDWLNEPGKPDYLNDNPINAPTGPVSPRDPRRHHDMHPQEPYDPYGAADPYLMPRQGAKYNPVSLGLVDPDPRGRYPDDGYRSLDPREYGGRYPMDDPRGYPVSPRGLEQYPPDTNLGASLDSKDRKKKHKKEKHKR